MDMSMKNKRKNNKKKTNPYMHISNFVWDWLVVIFGRPNE